MRVWMAAFCSLMAAAQLAAAQSSSDRAQALFAEGERAYEEGRFTDAAGLMREAYELTPEPILLYNLARALEASHDWQGAVDTYGQYLSSPGELTHRGRAEAHLRASERALAQERELRELAERQPPREEAPPPAPPAPLDPIPWIVAGGGLALVGAGAVFGVLMLDRQSAAQAATSHRDAYPIVQDGQTFAITADVLFILGGLTAAVGLTWAMVSLVSGSRGGAQASIGPGSLMLNGWF